MSNKTNDKNVANIEDDIKVLNKFCEYEDAVVLTDNALEEVQDAIQNILAEREQKDKRIKELEELVAKLKAVDYMFRIDSYSNRYDMRRIYFEWLDSIPKQAVINKIEELKNDIKNGNTRYPYIEKHKIDVLHELLEGGLYEYRKQ